VVTVQIAIGSDHAGYNLKELIKEQFKGEGVSFVDFGTNSTEAVDYPDIARPVAESVARGESRFGILICGTGIGMVIAANKVPGVRAALCHDVFTARAAREHNDANVLTLGEKVTGAGLACEIVRAWLQAAFQGGRHERRVNKIRSIEEEFCGRGLQKREDSAVDEK
jgi:ribose 5-phosphate isomerase B